MRRALRILAILTIVALVYPASAATGQTQPSASTATLASPTGTPVSTASVTPIPTSNPTTVSPTKAAKISYAGATLDIPPGAVTTSTSVTISTLSATALATSLDEGMANATKGPQVAYRFLPHMHFANKLQVSIPYDKTLIPSGFTAQDLYTYYFDTEQGQWEILDRVAVDTTAGVVISSTDHFTDMVNAVVVAPDHPQPNQLNPNSMADVKAANPTAAINLVQPPQANSSGDALLSYPIEVPPGRAGVQPRLNLGYSSSGGDGWLGLGWQLSTPSITIDTRWGVPHYDPALETETYMFDGEQLTPLAHRGPPQPRVAEKTFNTRVEGQFRQIVRHGSSPATYWWEVTEKNGVKSFFGGTPTSGPDPSATLRDASGNVFRWAMLETRDPNGNGMRLAYDLVQDVGVAGGSIPGTQLYLKSINYTQTNGAAGPYTVTFLRDSQLPGYTRRPDVQIDARGGFKQVTAELLKRIEVRSNGQLVRAYDLAYQEGAFRKTLLASVTQSGADGSALPPHVFSYFDDVRNPASGAYQGFGAAESWNTGADGVDWTTTTGGVVDKLGSALGQFVPFGGASAISGSVSDSVGGHLYLGFNPDAPLKQGSAGGKVGFNSSDSDTLLLLIDLNGDGLPDKVFRAKDGRDYVRLNQSGPSGATAFGAPIVLPTLPSLPKESSTTWSFGAEEYVAGNGLVNDAETFTNAAAYFADVNGDGLPDLVNNGSVLFNHLDANGVPTFTANSADTSVPIDPLAVDPTGLVDDLSQARDTAIDNFPLADTVRRWVAPFDGTVTIGGSFSLVQDTSPARAQYATADGVRVAIQQNGTELFSQTIAPTDYAAKTPTGVDSVSVSAGDRIYFRVGSVFDGKYDRVSWDPVVQYTSLSAQTDANGLDAATYQASKDFTLAGRRDISVKVPFSGTLRLAGPLHKSGATTDDATLLLLRNDAPAFSATEGATFTGDFPLPPDLTVAKGDVVKLRVKVDSPIDVHQLQWNPQLFYVAVTDPPGVSVQDSQGNYLIQLNPPYDVDLYPDTNLTAPQGSFVVPKDGTLTAHTHLERADASDVSTTGTVTFTIKKAGARLAKETVTIAGGIAANVDPTIGVAKGDVLFFDYSAYDPDLAAKLKGKTVDVTYTDEDGTTSFGVPSAFHSATRPGLFPQAYHGWSMAGYNGNRARATQPIVEGDLPAYFDPSASYDAKTAKAYLFYPVPASNLWKGPTDETLVGPDFESSARLGADYIVVPTSDSLAGKQAVPRLSRTSQHAVGGGASFLSGSLSSGGSYSQLEYLDMDGNGFPDVVGDGRVQYTTPTGGLEPQNRPVPGFEHARASTSGAGNVGVGGSPAQFKAGADGQVDTSGDSAPRQQKTGSQMVTLGLSGSLGSGSSSEQYDLLDVNGDGLPDLVAKNGAQVAGSAVSCGAGLCAALNLGEVRGFAPFEPWGDAPVNDGASRNFSLGATGAVGFNGGIYDFAGGISLDKNTSQGGCAGVDLTDDACGDAAPILIDLNGDGLPDRVQANGDGTLRVRFNTGNGFGPDVAWGGALPAGVAKTGDAGLGGGAYFTIGIPACLIVCYVIVNPGVDFARNLSREEAVIRDVDGDGYPEHLVSSSDGSLTVARNLTGRTNKLKSVVRPLGATIAIDYQRVGNTTDLPQSHWVMSKVSVFDGFAGDGADTQVTTYRYGGGKFDRFEREFYGFASVVEEHRDTANGGAVYRSVEHDFLVDSFYSKGLPTRDLTRDANGRPFVETDELYKFRDAAGAPGSEPTDPTALLHSPTASVFPELAETDHRFYEGNPAPAKSTFERMTYDALGNVSTVFQQGDDQTTDGQLLATFQYASCPAGYVVGKANSVVVTNAASAVIRQREATIDCATGNLTQLRQLVAPGVAAVSDLTYASNGNLRTFTGPPNGGGQRYALTYDYDPDTQTQVARITDSFGYTSSATFDATSLVFGEPRTTTDTNDKQTTYAYDAFGRMTAVTGPYEQGGSIPTVQFEYHADAAVPWALTRRFDPYRDPTGANRIDTATFVDGLGRVLQTKSDATVFAGPDAAAQDVMVVSGRLTFDAFGRKTEERYPVTEPTGTPGTFDPTVDAVPPTTTQYDVLDRPTKVTLPDNTSTSTVYGFGQDRGGATQFETAVTDANGLVHKSYRDARKLVTSVLRLDQGQPIWTSYRYDPMEQLFEVDDARNNATKLAYDLLGRRTSTDNPDTGRTDQAYDLASNVVSRTTANLAAEHRQISYAYDFNRLKTIAYPDFPGNNVTYTYGGADAASRSANSAGRIVRVDDESGSELRAYGKLGEMVQQVRTVVGFTGNGPKTYTTQYVYDTFGRLQSMTYPDGELLTYSYDSGGSVRQAVGTKGGFTYPYANRIEYDKFGERAFVEAGNGVRTQYTQDPRNRRLVNLQTGKPGASQLENLVYSYDAVGNVTGLADNVPVPQSSQFGGPTSQSFAYDDLYRLVGSTGTYQFAPDKVNRYGLTMAYDNLDNIVNKAQTNDVVQPSGNAVSQHKTTYTSPYTYGGPQPHAATHIDARTYTFDLNGNQTGWTSDDNGTRRTIVWDEENRVQSISDNGHQEQFKYDAEGQRVIKRGRQGETAYVNPYFTVRNGSIGTKHVYAGTTRLLSKLVETNAQERQQFFYHPDQLGSTGYVTDVNGAAYEHLEYFPFGETWVQESSNTNNTPYQFTGKELDEETDLYYYGARYYDPRTSQFISTDPLLQSDPRKAVQAPEGLAAFTYTRNNPLQYTDPDGRDVIAVIGLNNEFPFADPEGEAGAKSLQRDLASKYGIPAAQVHVVYPWAVDDTRDAIWAAGGHVSAAVCFCHGDPGVVHPWGGLEGATDQTVAYTVKDFASWAGVEAQGCVITYSCNTGAAPDPSTLPDNNIRSYLSPTFIMEGSVTGNVAYDPLQPFEGWSSAIDDKIQANFRSVAVPPAAFVLPQFSGPKDANKTKASQTLGYKIKEAEVRTKPPASTKPTKPK